MAIAYRTGTLNPSSSQKARDIRQALATAFSGISGWTLLDHNYVNTSTERSVLVNSAGFALMIYNSTTLTDTNLRFVLGQSYSDTTHTMSNIALGTGTTTNSTGFNPNTFNPTAITTTPAGHGLKTWTTTTNQTNWSAHIETTYAVLSFKDGTTTNGKAMYFGAIESLVTNPALTDTYPYVMVFNDSNNNGVVLNSVGNNSVNHSWQAITVPIQNVGTPSNAGTADYYNVQPTLIPTSPHFVVRNNYRPSTTESSLYGWLRGKLPNTVLYGWSTGSFWGDTVDLGTTTYMYVGGQDNPGSTTMNIAWWVAVE